MITDVTIVMPCYKENNEAVAKTCSEIQSMGMKVIVVDDGGTMELPSTIRTIRYYPNMGYGYALKQGIKAADTELVLTMDGDSQHTSKDAWKLYTAFKLIEDHDMVVGARGHIKESWYRWFFRKAINFLASCFARHMLVDLNSGMRIFKRQLALDYENILCDTFSFTTSLTMSLITDRYKVAYFPINVQERNFGKSRVRLIRDGLVTIWFIVWVGVALRTRKIRAWIRHILGR